MKERAQVKNTPHLQWTGGQQCFGLGQDTWIGDALLKEPSPPAAASQSEILLQ